MVKYNDYIRVKIYNRLYRLCDNASKNWWSSSKKGKFGKGVKNTSDDLYCVEREGLLGECGFGVHFRMGEPNWEYRKFGDKGDFFIGNYSLDVKMVKENSIQVENENGDKLPLKYDIYVFGKVIDDDRKNENAEILLKGFITKKNILIKRKEGIIRKEFGAGNWKNYNIPESELEPLNKLEKFINKYVKKRVKVDNSQLENKDIFF